MARKFVAEGAQVLIADRDEAAANRVAEALGAKAIRVDVAVAADVHAAVEAAYAHFGERGGTRRTRPWHR